jgi:protein CpxP
VFEFTRNRMFRRTLLWGGLPVLTAFGVFMAPRAYAFGPFGHHYGHHMAKSPNEVREHLASRVDFALDRLDASDAQREKIDVILDRVAPQFYALMEQGREVRAAMKEALLADTVDRAGIERAQLELDGLADRATDLGVSTLTDVAEVLTPAQRKKVAEHLAQIHP